MSAYQTGSAVFALDQRDNILYAGTRSGCLYAFDARDSVTKPSSRVLITLNGSITHVKCVGAWELLVSQMNG